MEQRSEKANPKQLVKNVEIPSLEWLNAVFQPLSYRERIHLLYAYFKRDEVLLTSSFGTNSVLLLWLIHQMQPRQKIHFIDTGYHFPETIAYKEDLQRRFNLTVIDVHPDQVDHEQTRTGEWWKERSTQCCEINKVTPLQPIKARHRVWISGLMAHQTTYRANLNVFEQQGDIIKFHPLIDLPEGEFLYLLGVNKLPRHPLEAEGFGSIGCTHCTQKGNGRSGRWKDSKKTECGLHPDFFKKK